MSTSNVTIVANIASITTCALEDGRGNKHFGFQGMVTFGPISLQGAQTNKFLFGLEIDQHFREAGWTLVGKNGAVGTVDWTLLAPPDQHKERDPRTGEITWPNDAPLFEQHWVADNGGDNLFTFNSDKFDFGGFPWEKGGPPAIGLGQSPFQTTKFIADAMGGKPYGPGDWPGIDIFWLSFPVDDFGTLANDRSFSSNGFFGVTAFFAGAGKTWESQVVGDDPSNQMKLRISMSMTGANYDGNLTISITALKKSGSTFIKQGKTYTIQMMAQPDYIFMLDPYSFFMFSKLSTFHADLYQNTYLFCTMLNTPVAMPQHTSLPPIPQVAIIGNELGGSGLGAAMMMGASTVWRTPFLVVDGSSGAGETGMSFLFIRNNPGPLFNNDDSDVIGPTKVLISPDNSGPGGTSEGPMQWMGNLRNSITMQRYMGPIFTSYSPDSAVAGEELLPKTYYSIKFQSGGEEAYIFNGTMCSVFLASADYGYLNTLSNFTPDPVTGYSTPGLKTIGESNLFTPLQSMFGASVSFEAFGGRPAHFDSSDHSHDVPTQWTFTCGGLPTDGSWRFVQDNFFQCHIESASPGSVGTWQVSISATDTYGNRVELLYNLVVGPVFTLKLCNDKLPPGSSGKPYFMLGGGSPSTIWHFVAGILPDGMAFDEQDGTLSGTPTTGGLYEFQISISDDGGVNTMTRDFSIEIG